MIKVNNIANNEWLELTYENYMEMSTVRGAFTCKIPEWFVIKKKCPWANVEETFYTTLRDSTGDTYTDVNGHEHDVIPITLWYYLVKVCRDNGISVAFDENFQSTIQNPAVTKESYKDFLRDLFGNSEMSVRDYQAKAAFNALIYKNSCLEVATSGGKTFMTYILFKYMIDVLGFKHILYVTPKTMLTMQSSEKFEEYDKKCHVESSWTYSEIYSGAKKQKEYNETIVFGNYQSLCKKPVEFFRKYDAVFIDECHHSAAKSLRNILGKCKDATYKIGLTGTFPDDGSHQSLVIQSYIGPVVYNLTSYELINEKKCATPVYVNTLMIKYLGDEQLGELYKRRVEKDAEDPIVGGKILELEKSIARNSEIRFKYITNMLINTTKNSLGIFSDVQNNYGRRIFDYVKDNSDKMVFYIDGNTPDEHREYAKQYMEDDDTGNTIIIASMQCFTEGIDIANMWNIFLLETTKSDNTLAQLLGRGMRMHPKKDKTTMIDFVDDFRYYMQGGKKFKDNYLYKHGKQRINIYKKRGFPCSVFCVDLNNDTSYTETDLLA